MASISAQDAVAQYHRDMSQGGHHGGHDMYIFHRDWHQQNRDPVPPNRPDPSWGTNIAYGTKFLRMHHEMVKAADDEPKSEMHHQSLISWYKSKGFDFPSLWDPLSEITPELAYDPDPSVFPPEILSALQAEANRTEAAVEDLLTRRTNRPDFALPAYFTRDGVGFGDAPEPYTGARKLADFQNTNQLGCCLVFPHNTWHGAIGGAMGSFWTAIADPIFYFGVHWYIDLVFDEFKAMTAQRGGAPFDVSGVRGGEAATRSVPESFTTGQQRRREQDIQTSQSLNRELGK